MFKCWYKFILIFLLAALLLVLGCASDAKKSSDGIDFLKGSRDTVAEIVPVAKDIATYPYQPKPVWQTVFQAEETDLIEMVSDKHVLIGMIQLSSRIAEPQHGDAALYNMNSGEQIWSAPRRDIPGGSYAAIATSPLIILQGSGEKYTWYSGINPDTGEVVWEHKVSQPHTVALDTGSRILVYMTPNKKGCKVIGLKIADGNEAWQVQVGAASGVEPGEKSLVVRDGSVYLASDRIYKLSSENGNTLWSASLPEEDAVISIAPYKQDLLAWGENNISAYNSGSGQVIWGPQTVGASLASVFMPDNAGDRVYIIQRKYMFGKYPSGEKFRWYVDEIHALDGKTGKKLWSHKPEETLASVLYYDKKRIYFTTFSLLTGIDSLTGEDRYKANFPDGMSGSSPLPDILQFYPDHIAVATEMRGVTAFSKNKDKPLWYQKVGGVSAAHFWYKTRKGTLEEVLPAEKAGEEMAARDARWWGMWTDAVAYQWSGYNPDQGSLYTTMDSFGSTMVLFQNSLALSSMIRSAQIMSAVKGLVERLRLGLGHAVKLHARSVQGDFFIRPYRKDGIWVAMVNLKTGNRTDLTYSAPNPAMEQMTMHLPKFTLDASAGKLITTGIGLDADNYQKYVKFKYTMPYPSILMFDLSALRFQEKVWDDDEIVDLAQEGETKKIRDMLEKGVWVDSRDSWGWTALLKAADHGQKNTVKLLLEYKANVNHIATYPKSKTALKAAASKGHADIVKMLLAAGADPQGARELAVKNNHPEVVKILDNSRK